MWPGSWSKSAKGIINPYFTTSFQSYVVSLFILLVGLFFLLSKTAFFLSEKQKNNIFTTLTSISTLSIHRFCSSNVGGEVSGTIASYRNRHRQWWLVLACNNRLRILETIMYTSLKPSIVYFATKSKHNFNLSPYDFSFTILVTLNEVSSSRMYRYHVRLL